MTMHTLRRSIAVTIPTTLLAVLLAGCAGQATESRASATAPDPNAIPTEVIETTVDQDLADRLPDGLSGELNFGMNLTTPPSRFIDENGEPVGYVVDLAKLLAQKLGLTAELNDVPFDQIVPGLAAGRYDLTITGMGRTPEREQQLDMIEYMYGSGGVGVPAGNPDGVDPSDTTTLCGLHLGALSGSFQELNQVPGIEEACAAGGLEAPEYTSFASNNEAILALGSRRIDAVLASGAVTAYAKARQPEVFDTLVLDGTWSHENIGLPKGSKLTPIVAEAFQMLMDEGTYGKVLAKWGVEDYALDRTSLTQTPVEK